MFRKLISNLPFSPQLINQVVFYARRLGRENATRRIAVVFAALSLVVQFFTFIAPPEPSVAASTNDMIYGGLGNNDPKGALLAYYDANGDFAGHKDIQFIFNHFGITRDDLANTRLSTIKGGPSIYGQWYSIGRQPHAGDVQRFNGFNLRPLGVWGVGASHRALEGKTKGGWPFAVIINCGNLAMFNLQPPPPIPPPPPPPPPPPELEFNKTAVNLSRGPEDPARLDANGTTVKAGEVIEYTISARNVGGSPKSGYIFKEDLRDILEYADLQETDGANLSDGVLTWPVKDIKANETAAHRFKIKIKDPVPATPNSASDPQSYDLCLDNVFEDKDVRICVNIPPPPKVVEQVVQQLPNTGPGLNALLGGGFVAFAGYFFFRNRQLIKEISVLRKEYNQG